MTASFTRLIALFALGVLAVLLAFGRGAQTQASSPTSSIYDYKVELVKHKVKHKKDLEGRLKEDGPAWLARSERRGDALRQRTGGDSGKGQYTLSFAGQDFMPLAFLMAVHSNN